MRDLSTCLVLLVDDVEANIDILVNSLEDSFNLNVAMNGENALENVEVNPPDLILLDIMMPGMDGYEVLKRLKAQEKTRDIPVILCTALTDVENEAKGFELGAVDYIRKPFSPPIIKSRAKTQLLLKMAQEDLKRQNEILKENIALREDVERITRHDIKTPINAMINVPQLLIDEGNLTPDQIEMLKMLEESSYRILDYINNSLDLYKMETKQYKLNPVPVDVLKILKQIHGETREIIRRNNLRLSILIDGAPVSNNDQFVITGEEMLCYSMLANLIKNAVEASPKGEQVIISLKRAAMPVITINNQGSIPPKVRDRFFEKYATSGKKDGTGLGTYSAKLIAESLGGKIKADSSEDTGVTVTVVLPGHQFEAPVPTRDIVAKPSFPVVSWKVQEAGLQPELKGLKVLIVDDYSSMRRTTAAILKQMGLTNIIEASDGKNALRYLETENISILISDWNMPNMSGLELLKFVRSKPSLNDMKFIMITGESTQDHLMEAAKLKINDYIIKPFSADVLKKKIEKHIKAIQEKRSSREG
ncbi:MAG: response regulator [Deltaproteobacteria bacterium]|nr:response regulator [Deltaproteobacteria bacterium]